MGGILFAIGNVLFCHRWQTIYMYFERKKEKYWKEKEKKKKRKNNLSFFAFESERITKFSAADYNWRSEFEFE